MNIEGVQKLSKMTLWWWVVCCMTVASGLAIFPTNNTSVQAETAKSIGFNVSDPPNPWTIVREPHTFKFIALPGRKTDHDYFTEVASRCLYDLIHIMHEEGHDTNQRLPGDSFGSSALAGTLNFHLADTLSNRYPFNAYLMSQVIYDMDMLIYAYRTGLPPLAFNIGFKRNSHDVEELVLQGTWLPAYAVSSKNYTSMALSEVEVVTP